MKVNCHTCGKEFDRLTSEVNRSTRLGRKQYCSRQCCGKDNFRNIPKECLGKTGYLKSNNRLDEYSPFRQLWRTAKRHAEEKEREFTITLQDLKNKWEEQSGKCPYTGWDLNIAPSGGQKIDLTPKTASLDRKDSNEGYTKNNIQIVAYMYNCAKNKFSNEELVNFCEAICAALRIDEGPMM